ncbi:MAG: glutamate ABC transporter substrate-binding protein [Promicromonosporaceae bacterium]|nr:glutamate ABC transporter substrate-binding protein [Promicromonosporaceae bacterium]
MKRSLKLLMALGAAVALVVGCADRDEALPNTDPPTLRIGIKFDQPGIGLMVDGVPQGFDVDVAAYIAWKLGVSPFDVEWVEAVSPQREQMLLDGAVDFVVASYSITEERLAVVDFAGPYVITHQALLVRADNTTIAALEDLSGRRVCAPIGTPYLFRVQEILGDSITVIGVERHSECARMLAEGQVDAMTTSDLNLAGMAASDEFFGEFRLINEWYSNEQIGIGLPQGSGELCQRINAALLEMVEDGSWQRFITRHTGGTDYIPDATFNPPTPLPCATP